MTNLPIIIIPGWASSSKPWGIVKKLLENNGFTVFVPDLPGFGMEPEPSIPFSLEDYAQFIKDFAIKNKLSEFNLIGHSFGGLVAIKYALLFPNSIKKLVLTGAAIPFLTFTKERIIFYSIVTRVGGVIFFMKPFTVLRPIAKKFLFWAAKTKEYYHANDQVMLGTFEKVFSENIFDLLSQIKVKTMIIWGENDNWTPLEKGKLLSSIISESKFISVEGTDHRLPFTKSKKFVDEVTKFCNNT